MTQVNQTNQELLFATTNATLHQCDASELYFLNFKGDPLTFRACELITFKRKIQKINIAAMLLSDAPDVEIVHMPHCDRLFALTIHDILELKELFAGAFTMLELNSMIHKELVRKTF
ncbi:MAG: hypothetical protein RIC53_08270 [Cyclobacteriaceae bacterium]